MMNYEWRTQLITFAIVIGLSCAATSAAFSIKWPNNV